MPLKAGVIYHSDFAFISLALKKVAFEAPRTGVALWIGLRSLPRTHT